MPRRLVLHFRARSAEHADNRRRYYQRKHQAVLEITARRNALGQLSKRGTYFTVEGYRKPKKVLRKPFLVSLTFTRGKDRRQLYVEAVLWARSLAECVRLVKRQTIDEDDFEFVEWWHDVQPRRRSYDLHDFTMFLNIYVSSYERKMTKTEIQNEDLPSQKP